MHQLNHDIQIAIQPYRSQLLAHPLYQKLTTLSHMQIFMEHHVYAVWDFMSLLKALQLKLTCVSVPWYPVGNGSVRRLVNEIVLGEESDVDPKGGAVSHFELYLQAMQQAQVNTKPVQNLLTILQDGREVTAALNEAKVPECVANFVEHTFSVIHHGAGHEIASAFTYGREDLIPDMFNQFVKRLESQFPDKLEMFRYYLDRHIQLDGDQHGELGRQMVAQLCGSDPVYHAQAKQAAILALRARIKLWDGICEAIEGFNLNPNISQNRF